MSKISLKGSWKEGNKFRNNINENDYIEDNKCNYKLFLDKYFYNYKFDKDKSGDIIMGYLDSDSQKDKDKDKDNSNIKLDYSNIISLRNNNLKLIKDGYEKRGYKIESFLLKQNGRMVIGLGDSDVKETSMTFHHTYGIPYIPGQAIKGVVRNYVICEIFEFDEIEALNNKEFIKIFGKSEKSSDNSCIGEVIFFDAFPIEDKINIKKDIIAVHYKDYYNFIANNESKHSLLSDDKEPDIISFLTVEDATFEFILGYKGEEEPKISGKNIFKFLKEALNKFGIGAKTSVGYGYFESKEE